MILYIGLALTVLSVTGAKLLSVPTYGLDDVVNKVKALNLKSRDANTLTYRIGRDANTLKSEINKDPEHAETVNEVFVNAAGAIEKFASGDIEQIVSGTLDIMDAILPLAGLTGPAGSVISMVSTIFNSIIGLFGGDDGPSMPEIVKDIVTQALRDERNRRLEAEADGVYHEFATSRAYLDGMRMVNGTLSEHEVATLSANVPIYQGVKFMGVLASEMLKVCNDTYGDDDLLMSQSRTCVVFANLYGKLAIMQDCIFLDMFTMINEAGHSPNAAGGMNSVKQHRLEVAKDVLDFIRFPYFWQIRPVAFYRLYPTLQMEHFLNYIGAQPSQNEQLPWDEEQYYVIRNTATNKFLWVKCVNGVPQYHNLNWLFSSKRPGDLIDHCGMFRFIRDGYYYWHIKAMVEHYLYVDYSIGNVYTTELPHPGRFTIIEIRNSKTYCICDDTGRVFSPTSHVALPFIRMNVQVKRTDSFKLEQATFN